MASKDSECTGDVKSESVYPVDVCANGIKFSIVGKKIQKQHFSGEKIQREWETSEMQCTNPEKTEEITSSSCGQKDLGYVKTSVLEVDSDKFLTDSMKASSASSCSSAPQSVFLKAYLEDLCNACSYKCKSDMYHCSGGILHYRRYDSADCSGSPNFGLVPDMTSQRGGGETTDVNGCKWNRKIVQCGSGAQSAVTSRPPLSKISQGDSTSSHTKLQHPIRSCALAVSFSLTAIWAQA